MATGEGKPLEITKNGEDFEELIEYPVDFSVYERGYDDAGCLAIVDDDQIFLAGRRGDGGDQVDNAWMFSKNTMVGETCQALCHVTIMLLSALRHWVEKRLWLLVGTAMAGAKS